MVAKRTGRPSVWTKLCVCPWRSYVQCVRVFVCGVRREGACGERERGQPPRTRSPLSRPFSFLFFARARGRVRPEIFRRYRRARTAAAAAAPVGMRARRALRRTCRRLTARGSRRRRGVRQTPLLSARLSRRTRTDTRRGDHPSSPNTDVPPLRARPIAAAAAAPGRKSRLVRCCCGTRARTHARTHRQRRLSGRPP